MNAAPDRGRHSMAFKISTIMFEHPQRQKHTTNLFSFISLSEIGLKYKDVMLDH